MSTADVNDTARAETRKDQHSFDQALAQLDSIRELVANLRAAHEADDSAAIDTASQAIHDDALSVEVRSGWFVPGQPMADEIAEYRILLCTGGPAVQIIGRLDENNEPETALLQHQDWGTPWTTVHPWSATDEDALLEYARCFYFGE